MPVSTFFIFIAYLLRIWLRILLLEATWLRRYSVKIIWDLSLVNDIDLLIVDVGATFNLLHLFLFFSCTYFVLNFIDCRDSFVTTLRVVYHLLYDFLVLHFDTKSLIEQLFNLTYCLTLLLVHKLHFFNLHILNHLLLTFLLFIWKIFEGLRLYFNCIL